MRHGFALISIAPRLLIAAKVPPAPSLEGYWKGSGIVSHNSGADHGECRVRYTRASGRSFSYTATCAKESGKYDLTGSVTLQAAAAIAGRWWVAASRTTRQAACFSSSAASTCP